MRPNILTAILLATTCASAQAYEDRTTGDGVPYRSYADEQPRHSYNAQQHGQYKNNPKPRAPVSRPDMPTKNQVNRPNSGRITHIAPTLQQSPGSAVRILNRFTNEPVQTRNQPAPKPPLVLAPHKNQPKRPQAFVRGSLLRGATQSRAQTGYGSYDAHGQCDSRVLQQSGFTPVKRVPNNRNDCYFRRSPSTGAGYIDGTRGSTTR